MPPWESTIKAIRARLWLMSALAQLHNRDGRRWPVTRSRRRAIPKAPLSRPDRSGARIPSIRHFSQESRMTVEFCRAGRVPAVWVVLALCALAHPVNAGDAADSQLPSIKSFFRNSDVADVRLSPSGKWLAMIVGGDATQNALAVVDVDSKNQPAIVANFSDANIRSFRWVGDDRLVFNLFDGRSGGGDQHFGPGLYAVHRDGSQIRQLVKSKREFIRNVGTIRHETLEWNHWLLDVPRDDSHDVIIGEATL
jgi:hypothetical protein